MTNIDERWAALRFGAWSNLDMVAQCLAAGADPDARVPGGGRPLHLAVERGSAAVVTELASRVQEIDSEEHGRTALWTAVHDGRSDLALILAQAGADPWRPMMAGWSPGRLCLAGPDPALFGTPPPGVELSAEETATVEEARRLRAAIGDPESEGLSLACVAGIDAAEAVRRLGATDDPETPVDDYLDDDVDERAMLTVGVTDVPGGCVVTQPWAFGASMPLVGRLLSAGTVCYAMYANPKSGNQGAAYRDGVVEGWDLSPGLEHVEEGDPAPVILRTYLYRGSALGTCCAYAGLRLPDARAITGPADRWVRLPERDWWATR